jgi:hypothetical protein
MEKLGALPFMFPLATIAIIVLVLIVGIRIIAVSKLKKPITKKQQRSQNHVNRRESYITCDLTPWEFQGPFPDKKQPAGYYRIRIERRID